MGTPRTHMCTNRHSRFLELNCQYSYSEGVFALIWNLAYEVVIHIYYPKQIAYYHWILNLKKYHAYFNKILQKFESFRLQIWNDYKQKKIAKVMNRMFLHIGENISLVEYFSLWLNINLHNEKGKHHDKWS